MRFTDEEKERIWDMHQAGVPVKRIARLMGRQNVSLRTLISGSGGVRPRARVVNERQLSLVEREEISRAASRPNCPAESSPRVSAERLRLSFGR